MVSRSELPELPDEFPEEDFLRDGPMREEIIIMAVEALNKQGFPDLNADTIWTRPDHREVTVELLEDCRPLPIVKELIADLQTGNRG
ncbi:hypothetical protein [Roseovarius sp.]|uniref:hypothetical protein n=1 Tax=Roseovarius sp. TaxID=1486281 RepID=UPI00356A90E6